MDHAAAQAADPLQRERHVGHGEIRQRCRVSRPGAARVDPDRGPCAACLTPGALPLDARLETVIEQPFPKAARPLGVIRRGTRSATTARRAPTKATARSSRISACPHPARPHPRALRLPGIAVLVIPSSAASSGAGPAGPAGPARSQQAESWRPAQLVPVGAASPAGCRAGMAYVPPAACGSIVSASELPPTCTRRGLAVSATGIVSVSTPCSQLARMFSVSSVSPRKICRV